jgi:hypothetical protein
MNGDNGGQNLHQCLITIMVKKQRARTQKGLS